MRRNKHDVCANLESLSGDTQNKLDYAFMFVTLSGQEHPSSKFVKPERIENRLHVTCVLGPEQLKVLNKSEEMVFLDRPNSKMWCYRRTASLDKLRSK